MHRYGSMHPPVKKAQEERIPGSSKTNKPPVSRLGNEDPRKPSTA